MKKEVFICDVCGAERKEANHWFVALVPIDEKHDGDWIELRQWEDVHEKDKHLCGQACVHKFVDEFLSR